MSVENRNFYREFRDSSSKIIARGRGDETEIPTPFRKENVVPDFSTFMLFAAVSLVLTTTPGPDILLVASRSVSQGRSAGSSHMQE